MYERKDVEKLLKLAEKVISSADDTGCTEDLTVCSKQAIENLEDWIVNRFGVEEEEVEEEGVDY